MENGLPQINNWNKIIIVIDIDKLDDWGLIQKEQGRLEKTGHL